MSVITKIFIGIEAIVIGFLLAFRVLHVSQSWIVNVLVALAIAGLFYVYMLVAFSVKQSYKDSIKEEIDDNKKTDS